MRRNDILFGTQEIIEAIHISKIQKAIGYFHRAARSNLQSSEAMEASTAMFTALNRYSIASSRFSESAQIIERLMELDELTDTSKWPRMASSKVGSQLLSARSSIEFAVNQLPKIISLLERSYNHQEENIESSTQVLSVTLPEEKGKASKPERIEWGLHRGGLHTHLVWMLQFM